MRNILPFVLLLPLIMLLVVSCGKESTSSKQPVLTVSVSTLAFGSIRSVDSLTVSNTGGGTLNWLASPGQIWITVNPNQGSLSAGASITVTVTIDRDVVPQGGDYSDNISFTSNGGSATVAVTMHKAFLEVAPAQVDFGASDINKQLLLTNNSSDTITWYGESDESYLSVNPSTGTLYASASAYLTASADRSLLVDGTHQGNFYFYSQSESLIVAASLEVTPDLSVSEDSLFLTSPAKDSIVVANSGYGVLDWTLTYSTNDGNPWLTVTPDSGQCSHTTTDTLEVDVDSTGLQPDVYYGSIFISSDGGSDTVSVQMIVGGGEWLYYDDGSYENAVMLSSPGYMLVRFNDQGDGPAKVTKFTIHVMDHPAQVKIRGWSSVFDQVYVPDSLLYAPPTLYSTSVGLNYFTDLNWNFDGSFFLGYYQPDTLGPYLSIDTTGTPALRSYFHYLGQWYYFEDVNFAIRAYVVGGPTSSGGDSERELSPDAVYFLPSEEAEPSSIDKRKLIRLFER